MTFSASEYLFLSEKFSDVTFIVENKSIPAHKILMASCPYFETMLFGATNESKMSVIELKNVTYRTFVEVLRCVYQGKVVISDWTPEEVKKLILIADEYQFSALGCVIAEAVNVDTHIAEILEDVVGVAKRLNCIPLTDKCAASVKGCANVLLQNEERFDKLPMELICYLIDNNIWISADARLVYSLGNWRKTASIQDKKRLLSKIDWKSLPGKYSEPLVRMFLEDDADGLHAKDWTNGLKSSTELLDKIAAVYLSRKNRLYNEMSEINSFLIHKYQKENKVIANDDANACVVIFFREQMTNVTKIKFIHNAKAVISVTLYGFMGETAIPGRNSGQNWEFKVPSNVNFWGVLFRMYNPEFGHESFYERDWQYMKNLELVCDYKVKKSP